MKKVLVLFGGVSSEHEVSLVSARSVIQNIPRDRYEVLTLGITKQGEWLLYEGDPEALPEDNWLECGKRTPAVLSPDASHHGLLILKTARHAWSMWMWCSPSCTAKRGGRHHARPFAACAAPLRRLRLHRLRYHDG